MVYNSDDKISDIVRADYRTTDIFKKHNINYCCSGQVSLHHACALGNLNCESILNELEDATRKNNFSCRLQYNKWKTYFLIDYIINVHHTYLYQAISSLEATLFSFTESHKKKIPIFVEINEAFLLLSKILLTNNHYEEEIVFPYIKQIDAAYRRKESYGNLFVRTLRKPLENAELKHEKVNELLRKIKLYTNNYNFPDNACTNHQVIYHKLQELHDDIIQHIYLETQILFPKATEIEKQLLQV